MTKVVQLTRSNHWLALHPNEKRFAALNGDNYRALQMFSLETGGPVGTAIKHPSEIREAVFNHDGTTLATACTDSIVRFFDMGSGKLRGEPINCHQGKLNGLAYSPDGKTLATIGRRIVSVWDARTGRQLSGPFPHNDEVRRAVFSPDGSLIATGTGYWGPIFGSGEIVPFYGNGEASLRLWDLAQGKPLGKDIEHPTHVTSIAFSRDGKSVASGCYDCLARMFDIPTPIGGDPEQIEAWIQVITGVELDAAGSKKILTSVALSQRKQRLAELGGPP